MGNKFSAYRVDEINNISGFQNKYKEIYVRSCILRGDYYEMFESTLFRGWLAFMGLFASFSLVQLNKPLWAIVATSLATAVAGFSFAESYWNTREVCRLALEYNDLWHMFSAANTKIRQQWPAGNYSIEDHNRIMTKANEDGLHFITENNSRLVKADWDYQVARPQQNESCVDNAEGNFDSMLSFQNRWIRLNICDDPHPC